MGGFECATHINSHGERLDMIAGTEHDKRALEDYRLLASQGMLVARDGLRWHLIERGGQYDFSSFVPMLRAARQAGVQVIWDLCHYGWPNDVDLLRPEFVERFGKFAGAVARVVRNESDEVPFYAPVNEISFLCWAAARDLIYPHAEGKDEEIKRQLVRASIAACEAVWAVDRRARFLYPEPIIHVFSPKDKPELAAQAQSYNEAQFDAWDMMAGRKSPELGGKEDYLDIIGVNYYHSNQWEHLSGRLRWEDEPRDPRWIPFHELLHGVWERYRRPLLIAETSHFGVGRGRWIREIAMEVCIAVEKKGIPVEGICLYPVIDRYDWNDRNHWHNSGLWDFRITEMGMERVLNLPYAEALREVSSSLAGRLLQRCEA